MNSNELLRKAAEALELVPGVSIWAELVSHLGRVLGVDWTFVAKFLPGSETKLRTLAVWHRGRPVENFEYELKVAFDEMPAQTSGIYAKEAGKHIQNAWLKRVKAESFGQSKLVGSLGQTWGLLAFAHSQPLEFAAEVEAMLRIYAFKACVELERELADERYYCQLLEKLQRPAVR